MRNAWVFKVALFLGVISILVPPLGTTGAFAEQTLSLEQAVSIALEKNLEVLSAREELAKAEGYLVYARSGLFPSIAVNGVTTKRNEDSTKTEEESVGNVSLSQYLYAGGVIKAGNEQARLNQVKARQDVRDAEETVALKVYDAYTLVLFRMAEEETAREALAYYENAARELGKRYELGLSNKLDFSRAVQQRENARAAHTRAKNDLSTARIVLFTLLRLDPESGIELSGSLEAEAVTVDREEAISRALAERPDLQGKKTAAEIQRSEVEIAGAGMRPTVTLSASYQFAYDSTPASSAEDDEWLASVTMKVPVFDGGTTRGRVMQQQAVLKQAEQAALRQEDLVRADVIQAVLSVESAYETVGSARTSQELAAESLRLAEVGYREGVNTQLDVLSARNTLTEARQALSSALRAFRFALASLWKAEGSLVNRVLNR